MNYKYFLLLLILFTAFTICQAQESTNTNNPLLNGLHKAGFEDLDQSQPIMLDGITIPVYSEEMKRLEGESFMKVMMSADYIPEPYIDSTKSVKLFLLRKATEVEKSQMLQFQDDAPKSSAMIGKSAIPFNVTDIAGNNYSLESLKGKVVVLNFWFVECKPCVMEIPELNKLVEKYKGKDIVFLGIATNDKAKLQKFLEKQPFNYMIIPDGSKTAGDYQVNAFPTHIIIDKNSTIAFATTGLGPTTMDDIEKLLDTMIK
jgi:alkyl hydroperoxide reductase subunit AhpC